MADQQNSKPSGFLKNLVNKLPYQSVDFNKVLGDLNPKYNTFEETGQNSIQFKLDGRSSGDIRDHLVVDTPASLVADVGFNIASLEIL